MLVSVFAALCGQVATAVSATDTVPVVTPEGFVTAGGAIGTPPRPDRPSVGLVLSGGGALLFFAAARDHKTS